MRNQNHLFFLSFIVGLFAFSIVFIINWRVNLIGTAFMRASLGFIVFSAFIFISHYIYVLTASPKKVEAQNTNVGKEEQMKNPLLEPTDQGKEQLFKPMQFEKIENSQEVVKGVRNWLSSED